ncbi:MAG TPA: MarC family protein [Verrucomicrobiota bacterium]|nr:MarC family protein [Verrucomicrobiota bacterium]HNU51532.1 MarC family protein [Verrucomicrobiota bacterium]
MIEYILLAFSSLFVIVDPIATVPAFLAMTPTGTPAERIRMARLACAVTAGMLIAFAWVGDVIFRVLGITLPAFQLAGSIVLMLVALDMLKAQRSRVQETSEETDAGAAKEDIAITPLAIPMLAGPGAITTAILLRNQAVTAGKQLALLGCILAVAGCCFLIFRISAHGARWLSPIVLRLTTRIMGLLLAAIAIQFAFDALPQLLSQD